MQERHHRRRPLERPVRERLSSVLAELFDGEAGLRFGSDVAGIDAVARIHGRDLCLHVTPSSRPGAIDDAATQLREVMESADPIADVAVVVPYMTRAGMQTARERGLDWIDLAGNAQLFGEHYYVHVRGRPDVMRPRGRPSSPFAPKSSRVSRALLLDPSRWWRQSDLAASTGLDDSLVSRVVRRLDEERLLERDGRRLRPRDPDLLLDAWDDDYDFAQHEIVPGHLSGSSTALTEQLHVRLHDVGIEHAFTGLPAAWLIDEYARFRLCSVYVHGDPHSAADAIGLRQNERGANVQLVAPNDEGVFAGGALRQRIPCVAPVQVYLDLRHLPERAEDAATQLRGRLWRRG
ncbi:hypothetical protein [Conexibacter arvalis]|uniref:HTH marR-type domain-containing protein n=1 Tax=Conexibacter arvalis TaxID=912552 RepID=A0A840I7J4_9ACTN|nr:hypothetical protein [Conexibacter arvalis]MBB4660859.1 hypothetical protein [Conexibacter arvalis]